MSFQANGNSLTDKSPLKRDCSSLYLKITWSGYVSSSASTLIKLGVILRHFWCSAEADHSFPETSNSSAMTGAKNSKNSRDRQACISNVKDWLSWSTMPLASPTGCPLHSFGNPCSYKACPVSWITPIRLLAQSCSSYRVVMRTSSGMPPEKGCALLSSRPFWKLKPCWAINFRPSFFCFFSVTWNGITVYSVFFCCSKTFSSSWMSFGSR